jgi:uncharacterized protein (TIGR02594 family)
MGQQEVPGAGDNPEIVSWFKLFTLPREYWHDATAWCAAFVNAALCLNGVKGLGSARAFDWLKFGTGVSVPQKGDVVVFAFSYVAFYLGNAGDKIQVIGGNQSDASHYHYLFCSCFRTGTHRPSRRW